MKWKFWQTKTDEEIRAETKALQSQLDKLTNKASVEADKYNETGRDLERKRNSKCPKCGSTFVNDRIKRQQGKIDGSSSGAFFFGTGGFNSSLHGELDTNEVNKCNDCKNEWKKEKYKWRSTSKIAQDHIRQLAWQLEVLYDARHCDYDPSDIKETYDSKAEKREGLIREANNSYRVNEIKRFFNGTSLKILKLFIDDNCPSYDDYYKRKMEKYWNVNDLLDLGFVQ